jgi:hypothetical protein
MIVVVVACGQVQVNAKTHMMIEQGYRPQRRRQISELCAYLCRL